MTGTSLASFLLFFYLSVSSPEVRCVRGQAAVPQADGPSGRRGQDRVRVRSWLSRACRVVMWR